VKYVGEESAQQKRQIGNFYGSVPAYFRRM